MRLELWPLLWGRILIFSSFTSWSVTRHSKNILVHIWHRPRTSNSLNLLGIKLRVNIKYCNLNDSRGLLDGGRSVSAVQHHNGMNVSLLVNYGDRFGAPVNAVPPALPEQADRSNITQQDTLLMQVLELECQLLLKAQSVAAKSQVQYKPETFMLSQAE